MSSTPLPPRISIVGVTGSGKSRLARALAARLGLDHLELDGLFHQPGWSQLPTDEFRARVRDWIRRPAWVVDGNYGSHVQDLVWEHAAAVVWLDLPRRQILPQLARRTVGRMVSREPLWNGNRERWRNLFDPRPQHNILLWAWTRFNKMRRRYTAASTDPRWSHLRFVRVSSRREATRLARGATIEIVGD